MCWRKTFLSVNAFYFRFYLATLEAALEHVASGQLSNLDLEAENPQVGILK